MAAAGIAATRALRAADPPMAGPAQTGSAILVDPKPLFELSPYLYMQFMEPLGATDGSVEAAWDHLRDRWREDVVEVTRELAPPMAWFWDAYCPDLAKRLEITASPLRASIDDLRGLAEAFVIVDENDVLRDEGEAYARKLTEAGVRTTSVRYTASSTTS